MNNYKAATQPTIYFIGVTTGSSSIMKVFPKWAEEVRAERYCYKRNGFSFACVSGILQKGSCIYQERPSFSGSTGNDT